MDDIAHWLGTIGLEQYAEQFADNDVTRDTLAALDHELLKEIGVRSVGHRIALLKAIQALGVADSAAAEQCTPITEVQSEAERRYLTVMFCDLVGSTAMSAQLDPEDMRTIIDSYQRCSAQLIERHGGFVARYMGDGLLAYFGYPHAHEHDAERAVQAGLALADAVPGLATSDELPLHVRVGVATGTVVVGDLIGSGEAQERAVVGETPNLAARLQSIAEPGRVVIADDTRKLLGDLFELEDLGRVNLKGISSPTRAWAALRASSLASRFDALRASKSFEMVGREEELDLLLRRWSQARLNNGQVVLLSGEAGIGKSHLSAALMARIAEEPHTRLRYFCSPQHIDSVLHPVIVHMERAAGFADTDNAQVRLDKLDKLLAQTATSPEDAALVAQVLSLPTDGRYPELELSPIQRRKRTLQALVAQLESLALQSPVLMIFEDAHWTDPTTLELFQMVVDRCAERPLLLVVTSRPEFNLPWVGQPHVTALTLNRLTESDVEKVIDRVVGDEPLLAEARQEIIKRTDGIPLFVEEMTKAVLDDVNDSEGQRAIVAVTPAAIAVPASLHALLTARLDRLGPGKEVVQIGAAVGREFSHALLAAVAGKPDAELVAMLDRLIDAGLLSQHGAAPHATYLFKHALVQDAAYGLLLREPRRALHARIAKVLEKHQADAGATEPEIVAHHFSEAELAEPACLYFERAGDRAMARSAYAEAVAHFRAALAQAGKLPGATHGQERELAILLKQAPAVGHLEGQRNPEIERIYQRAYAIAQTMDDDERQFKPLWGLWLNANLCLQTDVARTRADALVELGERSGNADLILESIHCRWSTANFRGDVAGSLAVAQQGIALYDPEVHGHLGAEFGGHDPGVCAHCVSGLALAQSGHPRDAVQSVERGIALSQQLNQPYSVAFGIMLALKTYQLLGNRAAVTRLTAQLTELAEKFDLPPHRSVACYFSAWARACGDTFAVGLQAMESEYSRVSAMGSMPVFYAGMLARARLEAGRAAASLELLDDVLSAVREPGVGFYLPEIHRLRGQCFLHAGHYRFDETVAEFEAAIAVAKEQQASAFQLTASIDLARAWTAVGDPGKGAKALREAIGLFAGEDVPDQLPAARQLLSQLSG